MLRDLLSSSGSATVPNEHGSKSAAATGPCRATASDVSWSVDLPVLVTDARPLPQVSESFPMDFSVSESTAGSPTDSRTSNATIPSGLRSIYELADEGPVADERQWFSLSDEDDGANTDATIRHVVDPKAAAEREASVTCAQKLPAPPAPRVQKRTVRPVCTHHIVPPDPLHPQQGSEIFAELPQVSNRKAFFNFPVPTSPGKLPP